MKLIEIAAVGQNRELGLQGDMPWKRALKQDLRYFQNVTRDHAMVMGRKTFESLPGLLPGRKHIVMTRSPLEPQEQLEVVSSLEEFLDRYQSSEETLYVIGGASLYEQFLPLCQEVLLTEIESAFPADTWFPSLDPALFERQVLEELEDGGYSCRRVRYVRKEDV